MKIENKTIVVWFSCGAASAVAAKITLEKYGENNTVIIVNTPIDEEHEDNKRFKKDVENWLNVEIQTAVNEKLGHSSIVDVFEKQKYMGGVSGAPCTMFLKKEARRQLEKKIHIDYHVLGFTFEEKERYDRFILFERENVLPVLIEEKLTKPQCFWVLNNAGISLPEIYKMGFANANCIGCVKAASPTYWNLVRRQFPEVFQQRAEQSRRIGAKLVKHKGVRVYLDELPEKARGGKINTFECGLFCEEKNKRF